MDQPPYFSQHMMSVAPSLSNHSQQFPLSSSNHPSHHHHHHGIPYCTEYEMIQKQIEYLQNQLAYYIQKKDLLVTGQSTTGTWAGAGAGGTGICPTTNHESPPLVPADQPSIKKRKIRKIIISNTIISDLKLGGIFNMKYKLILSLIKRWFSKHPEIEPEWTTRAKNEDPNSLKMFYRQLYHSEDSIAELRNLIDNTISSFEEVVDTLNIPSRIMSPHKDKKYFEDINLELKDEKYVDFYKSTVETLKQDRDYFIKNVSSWLLENIETTKEKSLIENGSFSILKDIFSIPIGIGTNAWFKTLIFS